MIIKSLIMEKDDGYTPDPVQPCDPDCNCQPGQHPE